MAMQMPQASRPSLELVREAAGRSTPTLHESYNKRGVLPAAIKPVHPSMRVCGPAFTVLSPPGDNLWLHRALYSAEPGDVLVVECGGSYEYGYWGEIMSHAARVRQLAGLVIDGCVRDGAILNDFGFPVFSRGLCMRGTGKDREAIGALNRPVRIGSQVVFPGDLVVGDADGVLAIQQKDIADVLRSSRERDEKEAQILKDLSAGKSTLEIYDLA